MEGGGSDGRIVGKGSSVLHKNQPRSAPTNSGFRSVPVSIAPRALRHRVLQRQKQRWVLSLIDGSRQGHAHPARTNVSIGLNSP